MVHNNFITTGCWLCRFCFFHLIPQKIMPIYTDTQRLILPIYAVKIHMCNRHQIWVSAACPNTDTFLNVQLTLLLISVSS